MPQTLSQIKSMLAGIGARPKHAMGQNFLHDANQMRRVVDAAELADGQTVLEVGPGTGALTQHLLDAGARVVAVELDRGLASLLRGHFAGNDRLTLVQGDALAGKHALNPAMLAALSEASGHSPPRFKLVANLPYQIASPLLINLAAQAAGMTLAVVMVQREVAGRITASPGGKDFGPLTVMLRACCTASVVAHVPPGCFWPAPEVDSAVVRLDRREQPLTDDLASLAALTHRLFSQRRKQLKRILGRHADWPAGIDPTDRPERLDVQRLVTLAHWAASKNT